MTQMADEVTESLLNQLRGDADKYQVMKLDQLVLSYKFIENVDQLEMTSEIQNTIYIPKEVGNSRAVNSKLAIVDEDIISSKLHNERDNLKKMAIMVARILLARGFRHNFASTNQYSPDFYRSASWLSWRR